MSLNTVDRNRRARVVTRTVAYYRTHGIVADDVTPREVIAQAHDCAPDDNARWFLETASKRQLGSLAGAIRKELRS